MTRRSSRRLRPVAAAAAVAFLALTGCSSVQTGQATVSGSGAAPAAATPASTTPAPQVAACPTPAAVATGTGSPVVDGTVTVAGAARTYRLWLPTTTGYDGSKPVPLILNYHGTGGTPQNQEDFSAVAAKANPRGYLVAGLQALDGGATTPRWTVPGIGTEPDDVAFTNAVIDDLSTKYCVDAARIYATGFSSGGAMTTYLACSDATRFAAVPRGGGVSLITPPTPRICTRPPIAMFAYHGTADPFVEYKGLGTPLSADFPDTAPFFGDVEQVMAGWATSNGCSVQFQDRPVAPDAKVRVWSGCKAATQLLIAEGGGHTIPGAPTPGELEASVGKTLTDVDMTTLMLDFFDQQKRV
jgi:polyhydroxybutyrate depolymerase